MKQLMASILRNTKIKSHHLLHIPACLLSTYMSQNKHMASFAQPINCNHIDGVKYSEIHTIEV